MCLCLTLSEYSKEGTLAFESMDVFMNHVLDALQTHGALAVRVFPPDSGVLLSFSDRLATEVVCKSHSAYRALR